MRPEHPVEPIGSEDCKEREEEHDTASGRGEEENERTYDTASGRGEEENEQTQSTGRAERVSSPSVNNEDDLLLRSEYFSDDASASEAPSISMTAAVRVGCWNIHGLQDYKQKEFLSLVSIAQIDILALTETHLVHSEQLVQWQKAVDSDGRYVWSGRAAIPPRSGRRGRGSGGVGLLVNSEWQMYLAPLPACEHDRLHFVRLDLPGAPFPLFIGVMYLAPAGGRESEKNSDLLSELEERVGQYQTAGGLFV